MKHNVKEKIMARMAEFKTAVLEAYKAGKDCVYYKHRCVPFEGHPDQLSTALEVTIEGTVYSLVDGLRNAARLAERGYLGKDLEIISVSVLAAMEAAERGRRGKSERKARQAALRARLARLWPAEMVERVFQWDTMKNDQIHADWVAGGRQGSPVFDQSARSEVIVADVLAVLEHVKAGGTVPDTYQDAVGAGMKLRFVTPERWESVKVLAAVLAWRKPKHKKPGSGHRRDRDAKHWGRHENKTNENGAGGTSSPV